MMTVKMLRGAQEMKNTMEMMLSRRLVLILLFFFLMEVAERHSVLASRCLDSLKVKYILR